MPGYLSPEIDEEGGMEEKEEEMEKKEEEMEKKEEEISDGEQELIFGYFSSKGTITKENISTSSVIVCFKASF